VTSQHPGRHLTTAGLLQHWENGAPVAIPLGGAPRLDLRIDPPRDRLTLRAPIDASVEPPPNFLAHVTAEIKIDGDGRHLEISTTDERLVVDGYGMLMAVADRIQLDGMDPVVALDHTLATWQSILAMRTRMSLQTEVGLFGELLVVRALSTTTRAAAWRGGLSEEHDFGFVDTDVEAKTTTGERRCHWVHGLNQLVPTGDSPLWLLSIQLTRAGEAVGSRLPDLIDELRLTASGHDRERIDENLAAAGWHEHQRDLFTDRWRLRTAPAAFHVTGDFPRLTPERLAAARIDLAPLRQVTYEIDLTGRARSPDPPSTVAAIIKHMGEGFDG